MSYVHLIVKRGKELPISTGVLHSILVRSHLEIYLSRHRPVGIVVKAFPATLEGVDSNPA